MLSEHSLIMIPIDDKTIMQMSIEKNYIIVKCAAISMRLVSRQDSSSEKSRDLDTEFAMSSAAWKNIVLSFTSWYVGSTPVPVSIEDSIQISRTLSILAWRLVEC